MKKSGGLVLLLALIMCFGVRFAFAETLKEILPELLDKHELVQSLKARQDAAEALLRQSRAGYLPSVDLLADGGHEDITKEFGNNSSYWRHEVTMRANQLITDFGLTTNTISKAKLALGHAEVALQSVQQQVLLEGATAYLNVFRARERLKHALRSEENIKKQTGMEEALVQKGAGLSSDVLQAKSQLAGAMALRVVAEGELEVSKNRFHAVFKKILTEEEINRFESPKTSNITVPETLEESVRRALENNPNIRAVRLESEMAQKDIAIRKSAYLPQLNLFAEGKLSEDDAGIEGYRNEAAAGVLLSYNLFRGGGDVAAVRAARENLTATEKQLENTTHLVEQQVRDAWQNLITLKQNAELLQNQATIVGEFLELARKERKLGKRTLLEVLNGEVTYINALSTATSARVDTKIALFNLLFAIGDLRLDIL